MRVSGAGLSGRGGGTGVTARGRPGATDMATANAPSSAGVCPSRAAGAGAAVRWVPGGRGEPQVRPQLWEVGTASLARSHSASE